MDGEQISSTYFSVSAASASAASGQSTITTYSVSLSDDFTLESGIRALSITARDTDGKESTLTVNGLQVYNNVAVQGTPMSYPNPFKPAANQSTTIKYTLTKDADIMLRIYDVTGRQVYSRLCAEGVDEGAKAGINYVSYNGRDAFGNALGNGLYHYFIVHQGSVVGRGQLAVLD